MVGARDRINDCQPWRGGSTWLPAGHRRSVARLIAVFIAVTALAAAPGLRAADASARIVSLGGAITEIIFELDAGDALVAVDSTSHHPAPAGDLPNVGYMRQLGAESILALAPDLVLAVEDAGPASVLDRIEAAGVRVERIPHDASPAGVLAKIEAVAAAIDRESRGARLRDRVACEFDRLDAALGEPDARPGALLLLTMGGATPQAAGTDTAAEAMIRLAGGRNAVTGFSGFRALSAESVAAAEPEFIIVTDGTLDQMGGRDAVLQRPGIASTPAAREQQLIALDALQLLRSGPRTPQAIRALARPFHPDIDLPPSCP